MSRRVATITTALKQRLVIYHHPDGAYTHSIVISSPSGREQETLRLSAEESQELADVLLGDIQHAEGQADHNDEVVT